MIHKQRKSLLSISISMSQTKVLIYYWVIVRINLEWAPRKLDVNKRIFIQGLQAKYPTLILLKIIPKMVKNNNAFNKKKNTKYQLFFYRYMKFGFYKLEFLFYWFFILMCEYIFFLNNFSFKQPHDHVLGGAKLMVAHYGFFESFNIWAIFLLPFSKLFSYHLHKQVFFPLNNTKVVIH